jgi:hypothetical protein
MKKDNFRLWASGLLDHIEFDDEDCDGGKATETGEVSGSHGGEFDDGCLLGCYTMQPGRGLRKFQR